MSRKPSRRSGGKRKTTLRALNPTCSRIERDRSPVFAGLVARHHAEEDDRRERDQRADRRVAERVDQPERPTARDEHRPPRRHPAQQRPQERSPEQQLLGERREHARWPGRAPGSASPVDRSAVFTTSWLGGVAVAAPRGARGPGARPSCSPMPTKNHGTSAPGLPRWIARRPKSAPSDPSPLRRATNASQAMIAKFCDQSSSDSSTGVGVPGPVNDRRHHGGDEPDDEGGDGVADAPADRGGAGAGRCGSEAERALMAGLTGRPTPCCAPPHDDRSPGIGGPTSSNLRVREGPSRRRMVGRGRRPDGRPSRSPARADEPPPTDLEPGADPGDPRAHAERQAPGTAGVASRPGGGVRTRPPTGRTPRRRRSPAGRRRCAGCRGSCSRSIAAAFLVSSLGQRQLVEDRPHLLAVRRARSTTATSRASSSTSRPARSAASSPSAGRRQRRVLELGPEGRPARHAARRRSRRRTSTSTTSTTGSNILGDILLWVLPLVLIIGLFVWMSRRAQGQMGAVMNIGRSRAKVYNTEKPKTTFDDVAGYGPVKQEIAEVVDFLKNPGKFKEIGARIPKGVLLVGPPGTGKTLIARAVAGEAGVPFVSVTGSDFMEMFVGVGAARVRDLFQTARKQAPAIIFVDEIDSIGRKRGAGPRRRARRARADAQPDARRDGRLRGHRGHRDDGRHQPARRARPRAAAPRSLRPPDHRAAAHAGRARRRSSRCTSATRRSATTSTSTSSRAARRAWRAPTSRTSSTRPRCSRCAAATNEVHGEDFDAARDRVLMGLQARRRWRSATRRRRSSRTTRAATRCSPTCSSTPTRCTRSRSSRPAWRSASPSSCRSRSATSTSEEYIADSLVRRVWAAASPRSSCSGTCRPARRTTSCGVTEMARKMVREWGMSRAHRADGVGLAGRGVPRRGPRAHPRLLRRDRARHRRRGRAHPARRGEPRPHAARRAPARARCGGRGAARARDRSTATRSRRSSTTRWATRSAGPARSCGPTAPRTSSSPCPRASPSATTSSSARRPPTGVSRRA